MNGFETGLKAAAFDACGAKLVVEELGGDLHMANLSDGQDCCEGGAGPEECVVDGRAMRVERREFGFEGRLFRVAAALDVEAERRQREALYARAYFDSATGLPNRELFDATLADLTAIRNAREPLAVAVLEIDRFGQIAAFHGASASDALAARIGERLANEAQPDDIVARVAPDEFCLVVAIPPAPAAALVECERLTQRLSDPYLIDGVEIFAGVNAGVCFWPSGGAADGLRRKAKAAAREAARSGGGARLFEPELDARERAQARVESSLRAAIRDRRIGCAFQPKFDFRAGEVDSLEVLMRWRDDEGAWSTPGAFLDLAHEVGLTDEITALVFEETIASIDALNAAFGRTVRLGFNIAARQACDTRYMRDFVDKLEASGQAHRFTLEITEEAFVPGNRFASRVLPMIREAGAGLSIDDFGSGYSSLATLADITADEIKVDRSLITGIDTRPRNQSVLRAIESIGEALTTEVMVEGVETEAEFAYLRDHTKIRVAQGYYFSRPVMLSDVDGGVESREAPKRSDWRDRFGRARER